MRVGFALPNIGPMGSAESVKTVAERAEALGYDSVWTIERLLYPVKPQTPYPATPDGSLPEEYKHSLDPLETLTFAAACTNKVALGTSVLDIPYYNPVVLARRLTTLDVLSRGRLRVGLGLGWSKDEFDATGATLGERGARGDEFLQALKAIWTTDPVEFQGKFYRVPRSVIQPKPIQKPHPPIYLAAFAPPAMKRLARLANGWNPVGIPLDGMKQMFDGVKQMAKAEGRDPAELQLVVRANLEIKKNHSEQNGSSSWARSIKSERTSRRAERWVRTKSFSIRRSCRGHRSSIGGSASWKRERSSSDNTIRRSEWTPEGRFGDPRNRRGPAELIRQ